LIVYAPGQLLSSASLVLLAATGLIVAGIYTYGKAGASKERETAATSQPQVVAGSFRLGLTICLICGVLGTAFVYGGKSSTMLVDAAKSAGAPPFMAFYVAYAVTFNAGAIAGVIFSGYKLFKNKTAANFRSGNAFLWNFAMAAAMGLLWYCALLSYGKNWARWAHRWRLHCFPAAPFSSRICLDGSRENGRVRAARQSRVLSKGWRILLARSSSSLSD
jgi:hypothetical protein